VQALTSQVGRAEGTAATARAQAAATAMEGFAAVNGGYAGATPELLRGIDPTRAPWGAVESATDRGYGVPAGVGDSAAHVTGPGGLAEAGPCPA
jgi:hypothetical protein